MRIPSSNSLAIRQDCTPKMSPSSPIDVNPEVCIGMDYSPTDVFLLPVGILTPRPKKSDISAHLQIPFRFLSGSFPDTIVDT